VVPISVFDYFVYESFVAILNHNSSVVSITIACRDAIEPIVKQSSASLYSLM
jgi:hypothetical protein